MPESSSPRSRFSDRELTSGQRDALARSEPLPGPCIEWEGRRDRSGYGVKAKWGGTSLVHRQVWIAKYGPIPQGMFVMHLCDNPPCYAIDHLRLGTPADNSADMVAKGRSYRPTHCANGHPYDNENTAYIANGWRKCRECRRLRQWEYMQRRKGREGGRFDDRQKRLSPQEKQAIIASYTGERGDQTRLAVEFGVSRATISRTIRQRPTKEADQ